MRTANELAEFLGATILGNGNLPVSGVANPDAARAEDLIYVDSARHLERAASSEALCVLVPEGTKLTAKTTLEVKNPKFAFAKAAAWLLPRSALRPEIHPTAIVADSARLSAGIRVGPYVVIEDEVEIGHGTEIEAFCFLGRGAKVGRDCRLHPRVTLYAGATIKDRVELHSGVVIGADGFGYVFGEGRHVKFPQIGRVEIGDDVEIGCNSAVDRGSMIRIPIGNEKSMRVEVRSVSPDANPYMVMLSVFKTGLEGETSKIKNLRQAERYLPDNIYAAIEDFRKAAWTTRLLGEDVKNRYADLKQASADRCPRQLGTFVKAPEVQFHHEVYNQFLWNLF